MRRRVVAESELRACVCVCTCACVCECVGRSCGCGAAAALAAGLVGAEQSKHRTTISTILSKK